LYNFFFFFFDLYVQGEELLMQQNQQVQAHHQVVEEILPEQMSDEVTKEVINQFLPQRKRKPRQPKQPGSKPPQKMIKLEPQASGSDAVTTVTTTTLATGTGEPGSEMIVEEQQGVGELIEQVGGEQTEQPLTAVVKTEAGTPKTPKDKSNSKWPFVVIFVI
jgi:hypothetical protein